MMFYNFVVTLKSSGLEHLRVYNCVPHLSIVKSHTNPKLSDLK